MSEETKPIERYRLGIDYSTKGVRTTSASIELTGSDEDTFRRKAREYFAWVDATYPPPEPAS
jgi:hypothetical protein|tara:strand:+ start:685 stop:870 length:186 start_codon:yes stop_codon:yes gene_type:complete